MKRNHRTKEKKLKKTGKTGRWRDRERNWSKIQRKKPRKQGKAEHELKQKKNTRDNKKKKDTQTTSRRTNRDITERRLKRKRKRTNETEVEGKPPHLHISSSSSVSQQTHRNRKPEGAQEIDQIPKAQEPTVRRITRTKKKKGQRRGGKVDQPELRHRLHRLQQIR